MIINDKIKYKINFFINPYESLSMSILRSFYPKLIANQLANITPIIGSVHDNK